VTRFDIARQSNLAKLRDWRIKNRFAYVGDYPITSKSIKTWLEDYVLSRADRNLYWVIVNGKKIGTLGENNITKNSMELSDVSRGDDAYRGAMHLALESLIAPYSIVTLKVRADNDHAIQFYLRNNFRITEEGNPYITMQRDNKLVKKGVN